MEPAYASVGSNAPLPPVDLNTIRSRLNDLVERARIIGFRVNDIADTVVGTRPEPVVGGGTHADRPPPSLGELTTDLENALARIDGALSRIA